MYFCDQNDIMSDWYIIGTRGNKTIATLRSYAYWKWFLDYMMLTTENKPTRRKRFGGKKIVLNKFELHDNMYAQQYSAE